MQKKKKHGGILVVIAIVVVLFVAVMVMGDDDSDSLDNEKISTQLQGSTGDDRIDMVKGGSPQIIPDITYEEAYGNFFGNPAWRYFDADDGSEVVEFVGDCLYYDEEAQVYIQFVLNQDDESFDLNYANIKVGEEFIDADETTIVELIYKPFSEYAEDILGEPLSDEVEQEFYEWYLEAVEEDAYYD